MKKIVMFAAAALAAVSLSAGAWWGGPWGGPWAGPWGGYYPYYGVPVVPAYGYAPVAPWGVDPFLGAPGDFSTDPFMTKEAKEMFKQSDAEREQYQKLTEARRKAFQARVDAQNKAMAARRKAWRESLSKDESFANEPFGYGPFAYGPFAAPAPLAAPEAPAATKPADDSTKAPAAPAAAQ